MTHREQLIALRDYMANNGELRLQECIEDVATLNGLDIIELEWLVREQISAIND